MSSDKTVVVALSGGVDSSVTALLLKQQGYNVIGLTAKMVDDESFDEVVQNAKNVADKLAIPHYVLDLSSDFKKYIIDYFEESYKEGSTPNPCILCNKKIKWGKLFDYAQSLGAEYFATGHYANIVENNGIFELLPASDEKKDQLYYLFELSQEQLSKTIFPLAKYEKAQIKQFAVDFDLPTKSAKESQDICFIKKPMTVKKYLHEKLESKQGLFIMKSNGKKIGVHNGYFEYTVGQRKGIGIAYSEPLYVVDVDAVNNRVYLGVKDDLLSTHLTTSTLNNQSLCKNNDFDAMVKIRYNMSSQLAKVKINDNSLEINFYEPISAITRGQAAVVYDKNDGHLIAGGWIN